MTKIKQTYPPGWNEERVSKLAEHYDNQTEDQQVAEHEAAFQSEGQTVMVVPTGISSGNRQVDKQEAARIGPTRRAGASATTTRPG